ncbi:MAG: hypothetical protein FJZ11_05885 [Candidatus Omnitrophica bacterium]|nr:hypothetical protein [Candidatus Omnitrophota bacterium]
MKYRVIFYNYGTYPERNHNANIDWEKYRIENNLTDTAIKTQCLYVDHHLNAGGGNYALAICNSNCSARSIEIAKDYVAFASRAFTIKKAPLTPHYGVNKGVWIKDGTVRYTKMPAIVCEPLFLDNPDHLKWIDIEGGQRKIAHCLADTILKNYPDGGLICLSAGHGDYGYKYSPGAIALNGKYEHDYCVSILQQVEKILGGADD